MNFNHQFTIICYCLGSKAYKRSKSNQFISTINLVSHTDLLSFLLKHSLVGMVYYELKRLDNKHSFLEKLSVFVKFHAFMYKELKLSLSNLSPFFIQNKISPVILKGVEVINKLYPNNFTRKTGDIDLLIQNERRIKETCTFLLNNNYVTEDENYLDKILQIEDYGLFPFYTLKKINSSKVYPWLEQVFNSGYSKKYIIKKENCYYVSIDFDIHSQLFVVQNSVLRIMEKRELENSFIKGYSRLRDFVTIPYVGAKFINDYELIKQGFRGYRGCLKLLSDFIKLIETSSFDTIKQGYILAKKWDCEYTLKICFSLISLVCPEIDFKSLPKTITLEEVIYDIVSTNPKQSLSTI